MATLRKFEDRVWALERIRIVIRADCAEEVGEYGFGYKATRKMTVAGFIQNRIMGSIGDFSVEAVDGSGCVPDGTVPIGTVKDSCRKITGPGRSQR